MSGSKKKRRKWLWVVIIPVLAILALAYIRAQAMARRQAIVNYTSYTARTGAIEVSVTGTGSLIAVKTTRDVLLPAGVTPADVPFEAGDTVRAGDTLAAFDHGLLLAAIGTAQDQLEALDARLAAASGRNASQYIKASLPGRVKQVYIADGSDITRVMADSGALMVLSVDGKMSVSFAPDANSKLAVGTVVIVTLPDTKHKDGEVRFLSPDFCVVTLDDDGPQVGDRAVVSLPDGTLLGVGSLAVSRPVAVTFPAGIVESVLKNLDDPVEKGNSLIKLRDTAPAGDYEQIYQDRLAKARQLNALLSLSATNLLLAPADGKITDVYLSAGKLAGTAAEQDMTAFTLEISTLIRLVAAVDEQDILRLAVGQTAAITLDALSGQSLTGTIAEIADEGAAGQDVTTYDVTIDLSDTARLKAGMHASAAIVTQRKEAIVIIPVEALQETGGKQFVFVGTAPDSLSLGEKRLIETGISDGRYVEVTRGLQAGEQINYVYSTGTAATSVLPFGSRRINNITNPGSSPASGN
jgi:multidrug efflux pump subunit AcrA (membrane-fusion protein)